MGIKDKTLKQREEDGETLSRNEWKENSKGEGKEDVYWNCQGICMFTIDSVPKTSQLENISVVSRVGINIYAFGTQNSLFQLMKIFFLNGRIFLRNWGTVKWNTHLKFFK
jgi:hypothetical protein